MPPAGHKWAHLALEASLTPTPGPQGWRWWTPALCHSLVGPRHNSPRSLQRQEGVQTWGKIMTRAKLALVPSVSHSTPTAWLPEPVQAVWTFWALPSHLLPSLFKAQLPWAHPNAAHSQLAKLIFLSVNGCGALFSVLSACHSPKEWWGSGHWKGWQRSQVWSGSLSVHIHEDATTGGRLASGGGTGLKEPCS